MQPGAVTDHVAVNTTLVAWRREAVNAWIGAAAILCLPAVILILSGQGPSLAWPGTTVLMASYLTVVAGALLRRLDHTARLWAVLAAGYVLSIAGGIALPHGPFVRALPIALAIIPLVLIGVRAGHIATLASAAILLIIPFLHAVPGMAQIFVNGPIVAPDPLGLTLTHGVALTAILVPLMILLGRFHLFLMQALSDERRAAAGLEQEVAERAAAHRSLECEILERRRLEREIDRITTEERRRLGRDVHDGVCQQITGALLRCQALERRLERGGAPTPADVAALSCLLEVAIEEAYAVARGLCPLEPVPEALAQALRSLVRRTQGANAVMCEFIATGDTRVSDPAMAQHLYRIGQEALSNAVHHAQASRIVMELRGCKDELVLRVEDDGVGMPAEPASGGMGLRTMAYRAQAMVGTLTVDPAPEGGTRVVCRISRKRHARPDDRPRGLKGVEPDGC